ncbi:glutathione peroxidase [Piscinibacter koreensis]|uniref:Glutathione peroxidase n=1 Tax=Piscinibacter koreensis TaxID=2742824 RepID=A0A7Y6NKT0_9BURK|nr:glutathione peroxidase [Schlegelella koreensis]NUZ05048.1 glutathione peroxidase [Schlegelella koreensis]
MPDQTLTSHEGQTVPDVSFRLRRNGEWQTLTTDELFGGKNVIVFSLPGAFTPTCSSTHLPRYNELAPVFKQHGIDTIVCVSVNDPFVMEEWGRDQEAENVLLLPDGNGAFTEAMGMLVDKSDLNFGKRSWRYSMLVRDKKIEKMFLEPQKEGDPFEVSDADTMLEYLAPGAKPPEPIAILTRQGCSFCAKAKKMLDDAGLSYAEVPLPHTIRSKALGAIASAGTVPQVFVGGKLIGGSEQLEAWLRERGNGSGASARQ